MKPTILLAFACFAACSSLRSAPAEQEPVVTPARKGMVVTTQQIASEVGLGILKQGGNAIDAAVAVGYALAVVDH